MVGDEDVEASAERVGGPSDECGGHGRVGQVTGAGDDPGPGIAQCVAHRGEDVLGAVRAPGLAGVVRHVVVQVDARPVGGEAAGDGVSDAAAAAGAGDQRGPAAQGQGVAAQFCGGGVGKTGHGFIVVGPHGPTHVIFLRGVG